MHDDVLYKMAKIKLKSDSFAILYLDPPTFKNGVQWHFANYETWDTYTT